jgi:predicted RNA-binding Zn ribbon-like protein
MSGEPASEFKLYGGHAALDFANTVGWRLSDTPHDYLESYEDLLAWSLVAKIVDEKRVDALRRIAGREPRQAARALRRAIELREASYRVFEALIEGARPSKKDLEILNGFLKRSTRNSDLSWTERGFVWKRVTSGSELETILEPIARSVGELLTSEQSAKIRQCQDDRGCGWLFLDQSRSKHRRWCSMADCGNRAKAKRHYQRSRV